MEIRIANNVQNATKAAVRAIAEIKAAGGGELGEHTAGGNRHRFHLHTPCGVALVLS